MYLTTPLTYYIADTQELNRKAAIRHERAEAAMSGRKFTIRSRPPEAVIDDLQKFEARLMLASCCLDKKTAI